MARRNIKIDLRLNEQEMERLRRDVARSGWSREKYLRALIEHSIIKEMPSMDLVAVLRNLQQIIGFLGQQGTDQPLIQDQEIHLLVGGEKFLQLTAVPSDVQLIQQLRHPNILNLLKAAAGGVAQCAGDVCLPMPEAPFNYGSVPSRSGCWMRWQFCSYPESTAG